MPTSTTNYGLIKPGTDDPILIGQLNDNMDTIDTVLKENADAIENKPDAADIPTPSTAAPAMDGTASPGTSEEYARADHVHPSDTSKQDALTAAQLAAVNSGITSADVEQIKTNENSITLLRTFMAYVGYAEIEKVEKYDNEGRMTIWYHAYYSGSDTVSYGYLVSRELPIGTALTVENADTDVVLSNPYTTTRSRDLFNDFGVSVVPYITVDNVRHYGVQQRYFYNDL